MSRRDRRPAPPSNPAHVTDSFATGFELHEYEDWVRLVCWAERDPTAEGDGHGEADRRITASLAMPRSALRRLWDAVRHVDSLDGRRGN